MLRHGMTARELWSTAEIVRAHPKARVEGVALHLPLANGAHLSEVHRLMTDVVATELPLDTVWVSHLSAGRADRAAHGVPRLHLPPADRHRPVARRPRRRCR